jgi:2-polyprenyl-3-methyl-5-hydroxy-6-metoxy-1,4-benzoquinol methylase
MNSHTLVTQEDGWRRVEPQPTAEELEAFYAGEYFQRSVGTYEHVYTTTELAHRSLLARLMLLAIAEGRGLPAKGAALLEIGCGEGWFLAAAEAEGYAVRGVDFSDDGLKRHNPRFLDRAQFGDAFAVLDAMIDAGASADVCTLEHVLEHVADPEALLSRLPRLLKPGGVVAITVPNDFSPLQRAALDAGLIDREFWVAPPQHLNYFNTENLPRLLRRLGFEVRVGYASFPIDWYLMHPGSNYVADPSAGKPTHAARMAIDLMLAEAGMGPYLNLARSLFACGAGRSLTVVATPKA